MTDDDFKKLAELIKPQELKFFGFRLKDFLVIIGVFMSVYAFYVRTNDTLERLTKISERLSDFADNSDSYHSAMTGIQFKQGRPLNSNYDLNGIKKTPIAFEAK